MGRIDFDDMPLLAVRAQIAQIDDAQDGLGDCERGNNDRDLKQNSA